ncbi:SDR family NAD(P)-dependent oxidoreductase [Colwellia echini]|uniref:SDR family NAD(P)-dependent oxidoreductase n=1 Tax=Colwellia echini TaxID=1982103 RepID=A0ABY3N156_9GAMM|nr:SDR family NAD(P)-dependent oxidoreductase [Colwellia echini]TYK67218.1 SDR family NAD(P)-dependent oxidoreductase [Colwellia echini]
MKTVVITGANRGLGLGFCKHYLSAGWQVIALSRVKPDIEISNIITDKQKAHFHHIDIDLLSEESINNSYSKVAKITSSVDLVLNNAGVAEHEKFGHWTQQAFIKSFTINAIAPALLTQTISPLLSNNAKVIQLTSGLASLHEHIGPLEDFESYSMSKVAVNMLSLRLAVKLAERQITVCSISPGWVKTSMGGDEAPTSVSQAVTDITNTIEELTISQSGGFFDELGNSLSW